jgi:hypothetical protein
VSKGECSGIIMHSCMKMEKWDLLKVFQEWGEEDKEEWMMEGVKSIMI